MSDQCGFEDYYHFKNDLSSLRCQKKIEYEKLNKITNKLKISDNGKHNVLSKLQYADR